MFFEIMFFMTAGKCFTITFFRCDKNRTRLAQMFCRLHNNLTKTLDNALCYCKRKLTLT